jgi:hypothetical protein
LSFPRNPKLSARVAERTGPWLRAVEPGSASSSHPTWSLPALPLLKVSAG